MTWPWVSRASFDRLERSLAECDTRMLEYLERAVKAEAQVIAKGESVAALQRELMRARASLDSAESRHTDLVTRLVAPHPDALQPNDRAHMDEMAEDLEWERANAASEQALREGRHLGPVSDHDLAQELIRQAGGLAPESDSLYD